MRLADQLTLLAGSQLAPLYSSIYYLFALIAKQSPLLTIGPIFPQLTTYTSNSVMS